MSQQGQSSASRFILPPSLVRQPEPQAPPSSSRPQPPTFAPGARANPFVVPSPQNPANFVSPLKRPPPPREEPREPELKPTTRVLKQSTRTTPPKKAIRPRTNKPPAGASRSEDKSFRQSSLVETKFEMGHNMPYVIMQRIVKDIAGTFGQYKVSRAAIEFLHLASEWRLTERFKLASHVTRARQRKTLSAVDLETVDLIENDMFLRRKSCPQIDLVVRDE